MNNTVFVSGPSQRIHRFILPPHSKHVLNHPFYGGGIVLAKMLHNLIRNEDGNKDLFKKWNSSIKSGSVNDRYIKLAPFAATPDFKRILKPDIQLLRVQDKEDSESLYSNVSAAFKFEGGGKNICVIGGDIEPQNSRNWKQAIQKVASDYQAEEFQYFYILAKSWKQLKDLTISVREANPKAVCIGQIDVKLLAVDLPIQIDTSYEKTVGDICRYNELVQNGNETKEATERVPILDKSGVDVLVIRIGTGACLTMRTPKDGTKEPDARLFFHPNRCAPSALPGLGSMLAYDMILCASVVNELSKHDEFDEDVYRGVSIGIQATYRCFTEGFGVYSKESVHKMIKLEAHEVFTRFIRHGRRIEAEDYLSKLDKHSSIYYEFVLPSKRDETPPSVIEKKFDSVDSRNVDYSSARSPNKFWRIIMNSDNLGSRDGCLEYAKAVINDEVKYKQLAIVKFGQNELVDRGEVEDYLYLQSLLLNYYRDNSRRRPLCVGVFGPPGAGKSFGVKQLMSEMSSDVPIFAKDDLTINLSQVMSLDELVESFHRVRDECLKPTIPLVFFDEFDSSFEGKPFGWLKYFLAPMQDGNFSSNGKSYNFGKAVFVFAGGINHTFAEFNERSRNPEFCGAKGPDFISRLRGVLNIRGNSISKGFDGSNLNILKRALFLRRLLTKHLRMKDNLINDDLAVAFLSIPSFKHGARSLEAILEMSDLSPGQKFSHSQLPLRDQLDMHVDAREFLRLAGVESALSIS